MKLVKLENGRIELRTAADKFVKAFPTDAVMEIEDEEAVRLNWGMDNKHDLYAESITSLQVLPNAATAFSGSAYDLADELSSNFFFEVVGESAIDYTLNQYQHFLQSGVTVISSQAASTTEIRGYYITIEKDVTLSEIAANILTAVAGNSVVGLYDLDDTNYPDQLIVSSAVLDNSITGLQITAISENIKAGNYFVCYSSSSAATFRGFLAANTTNTANFYGVMSGTSPHSGLRVAYAYTGSLPSTFPASAAAITGNNPYVIFKIA